MLRNTVQDYTHLNSTRTFVNNLSRMMQRVPSAFLSPIQSYRPLPLPFSYLVFASSRRNFPSFTGPEPPIEPIESFRVPSWFWKIFSIGVRVYERNAFHSIRRRAYKVNEITWTPIRAFPRSLMRYKCTRMTECSIFTSAPQLVPFPSRFSRNKLFARKSYLLLLFSSFSS